MATPQDQKTCKKCGDTNIIVDIEEDKQLFLVCPQAVKAFEEKHPNVKVSMDYSPF